MKEALLSLPPSDLRTLSAGIRSGRLCEPYPVSSVGRFLKNSVCAGASDGLLALAGTGMSPIALASALDLVASALESRPALHDEVDVVTTSPDNPNRQPRYLRRCKRTISESPDVGSRRRLCGLSGPSECSVHSRSE